MDRKLLEERKKTIYEFICDELYVPMKAKEMAMILQVPKNQRAQLQEVLDALVEECRIEVSKKGKYTKSQGILSRARTAAGLSIWTRCRSSRFRRRAAGARRQR